MSETVRLLDTCVFVACGRVGSTAYDSLARRADRNGHPYEIPPRVYEELGGDQTVEAYESGSPPVDHALEAGWLSVTRSPEYTNPVVSRLMDQTRRFIADRARESEDAVEKADTALVGVAAGRLDSDETRSVEVYTGDKLAGQAVETLLPTAFDGDRVEWIDGNDFVDELHADTP